jgi:hypothetical protein
MMMMEDNSDELAVHIVGWIESRMPTDRPH